MQLRIQHYDTIAGLMLLFMMHHHICGTCGLEDSIIHMLPYKILYFYMAYFFFKAGIFYHPERTVKEVFVNSVRRLLVPYLLFTAIGYVWFGAQSLGLSVRDWNYWWWPIRQIFAIGRVEGNGPLWFLLSLFLVRVIFQATQNKRWAQISLVAVCILIAVLGNYFSLRPRTISNVALGIVFYGSGVLLRDIQYSKWVGGASVCIWIVSYIFMSLFGWHLVDFSFNTTVIGNHIVWLVNCVFACVAVNFIFWKIPPISRILSWLGRNSMTFLCVHALIIKGMFTYWHSNTCFSAYQCLVFYWGSIIVICTAMTYVFKNKYLSWIIGEKSC